MAPKKQLLLVSFLALSAGGFVVARGGGDAFVGGLGGSLVGSVVGSAMTSGSRSEPSYRSSGGSDKASRRIDKLSGRVDDLNDAVSAVRSDFGNDVRSLRTELSTLADTLRAQSMRLQDAENTIARLRTELSQLKAAAPAESAVAAPAKAVARQAQVVPLDDEILGG